MTQQTLKLSLRIRHLILFIALFAQLLLNAQEGLRPLTANPARNFREAPVRAGEGQFISSRRSQATSVQLPFKDDFFYAHTHHYPAPHLWADSNVYVNTGYPIAPPSLGVATFDGLNKHGYPHEPNNLSMNSSKPADTLTSLPINLYVSGTQTLLPSDSIGLVFYYQLRGYGDNPESTDSLIVDLYDPTDSVWQSRVWFQTGSSNPNVVDTSFKRVFIRIDSADYFKEDFRFRIRNRATTSGDFDHWHIDYVHLDKGLPAAAPVYDDVTFAYVPTSLLRDYSAMPWRQYRASEMTDMMRVWIKNNSSIARFIEYEHTVYDKDDNAVYYYDGGTDNLFPFADSGYSDRQDHAFINISKQYSLDPLPDTVDYRIEHVITRTQGGSGDYSPRNDTVEQYQLFRNYYAYDDGSAEAGYYVNAVSASMAIRIRLFEADTLRAMRIYFDPVGRYAETKSYQFRIHIWSAGVNGPGPIQYSLEPTYKQQFLETGLKSFPEYELMSPIPLQAGTYYIGIQQQGTQTVVVGLDRNYDNHGSTYYNSGAGWVQSSVKGSLLMRPVFGAKRIPVGLDEKAITKETFRIFPNPASGQVVIAPAGNGTYSYTIADALGKIHSSGFGEGTQSVNVQSLVPGIYFVTLSENQGRAFTKKLLISR